MPKPNDAREEDAGETAMLMRRRASPPESPLARNRPGGSSFFPAPFADAGGGGGPDPPPWRSGCYYLSNVVAVLLGLAGFSYSAFLFSILIAAPPGGASSLAGAQLSAAHQRFLSLPSNGSVAALLYNLTQHPHVAGTPQNFETAAFVSKKFQEFGMQKVHYADYPVLLSYPISRSLTVNKPFKKALGLREGPAPGDPYSTDPAVVDTFHAYSPSGTVTAELAYANYGRAEDFAELARRGVNCSGKIVIVRYGEVYRGDKGLNAAKAGAVGVLVYSDPEDYAPQGTGAAATYPAAQWLPPTGVQRGSISAFSGDPQTPGWPSKPGGERVDNSPEAPMPPILSLPISYGDAAPLLVRLGGPDAPPAWRGGLNLTRHALGPGPVEVTLSLQMNQTVATIRNVIAIIEGAEDPDRYVLMGNHRDAWTFGAADPNSGTAALLETARGFGQMLRGGWRPRRTIVLCSWDAEEYALIGSTEWAEDNAGVLGPRAVAYLNVDVAVAGPGFEPSATPQLDSLLFYAAAKVEDPDHFGRSLLDTWTASQLSRSGGGAAAPIPVSQVGRLGGGGSDFAPFLQHLGIASSDFSFGGAYPVYHSVYDNYHWMEKFGDPGFHRHVASARMWGIMALKLADDPVLYFNYTSYAAQLQVYAEAVNASLAGATKARDLTGGALASAAPIVEAVAAFAEVAAEVLKEQSGPGRGRPPPSAVRRRALNDRLLLAERAFLDAEGLGPGRRWFKHLVFAPAVGNSYGTASFPGVSDAIAAAVAAAGAGGGEAASWQRVQHEVWRAARAIQRATSALHGELV